jgi:hypothetical protein
VPELDETEWRDYNVEKCLPHEDDISSEKAVEGIETHPDY